VWPPKQKQAVQQKQKQAVPDWGKTYRIGKNLYRNWKNHTGIGKIFDEVGTYGYTASIGSMPILRWTI